MTWLPVCCKRIFSAFGLTPTAQSAYLACRNSSFRSFLHTFSLAKTPEKAQLIRRLNVPSRATRHGMSANTPHLFCRKAIFGHILSHFQKCAKTDIMMFFARKRWQFIKTDSAEKAIIMVRSKACRPSWCPIQCRNPPAESDCRRHPLRRNYPST